MIGGLRCKGWPENVTFAAMLIIIRLFHLKEFIPVLPHDKKLRSQKPEKLLQLCVAFGVNATFANESCCFASHRTRSIASRPV